MKKNSIASMVKTQKTYEKGVAVLSNQKTRATVRKKLKPKAK